MKLLFFINRFSGGGAERVMATLTNHLASIGVEVVIDYDTNYPKAYNLDNQIVSINHFDNLNTKWFVNIGILRFPYKLLLMRRTIKKVHPDCVISFVTEINGPVILSALGLRVPVIVSEHTRIEGFNNTKKNIFIKKYIYRFASAVTVLTRHDYHIWHKYRNVVYMPNPISINRSVVDLSSKEKYVLGVGRVDDYQIKGLDTLLKCWSMVCHDCPEWQLHIAGGGTPEKMEELEAMNQKFNNVNVKFLGFRKDINEVMQKSSIFVLPSRVEGLPMGLMEAMNQNCCCVAFNVETGPSEIIKDGKTGILVDNQNVERLSESLKMVMLDDCYRMNLASKSRDSIEQFSIERVTKRWMVLFDLLTK